MLQAIVAGGGAFMTPGMGNDYGIDVVVQLPDNPATVAVDTPRARWRMSALAARVQVKNQQGRSVDVSSLRVLHSAFKAGQAPGFLVFVSDNGFDVLTPAGVATLIDSVDAGRSKQKVTVPTGLTLRIAVDDANETLVPMMLAWAVCGAALEWLRTVVGVPVAALESGVAPSGEQARGWVLETLLWQHRSWQLGTDAVHPTHDQWGDTYREVAQEAAEAFPGLFDPEEQHEDLPHEAQGKSQGMGLEIASEGYFVPVRGLIAPRMLKIVVALLAALLEESSPASCYQMLLVSAAVRE